MSVTTLIALRYIKTSRENRFFSWISFLSIVGISIGVAALIVVLSVINGFEDELRNRFLAANAHILAFRYPAGLAKYEEWESTFKDSFGDEMTGTSPFVHSDTMGRKDHIIHSILIKGIAPKQRENVQKLRPIIRPPEALDTLEDEFQKAQRGEGLPETPGIILGVGLASLMQAKEGDTVEVISPSEDASDPFGQMQKYRVLGFYDSGLQHYDSKLGILSLSAAQALFRMGDLVTGLEIGLKSPDDSIEIAQHMSEKYSISIKEWQSFNQNIFEAMRNERTVIAFIVALVAFVASFNILITLFVSVTQKQRDISILKALGASNPMIVALFLKQSAVMGVIGGGLGLVIALLLSWVIKNYPFINLPDIYLLATLPVEMDWRVYLGVALSAIIITALAGLYPAWSATRISPTQGLVEAGMQS